MKKKISLQSSNLPIIILVILFGLSVSLMTGCGSSSTNDKEMAKPDSIVANNKATTQVFTIEQKANALVGKWETTTALDDKIAFEFSPSQKEGDTYVGTYIFYVNDTKDAPAKYIVSGDKMIKFFTDEGKEYPLIRVSVSVNGDSLVYFDQKDEQTRLVKATEAVKEKGTTETTEDCIVKKDNTQFFVSATEKNIKLKKGTPLSFMVNIPMNQGIITVKAKVGNDWIKGEIKWDDTTCN